MLLIKRICQDYTTFCAHNKEAPQRILNKVFVNGAPVTL